ncbi:ABC transporter permease [Herpetosiphon llansteffanensis]|uniref:ABC transporter permease n=1 Tax=Herpetosiphon llansteffanensis TaxID=2094568 RepID=UPI000D7CF211|nr:ABC transporter permease [Herpetosiphon llansteffanensis]
MSTLIRQIAGRLLSGLIVLWMVSVLAFLIIHAAPGDPARMLLNANGLDAPPVEAVEAKRRELGLDQPLLKQYSNWIGGIVQGNFGNSYHSGKPVWLLYRERLPATLLMAGLALTLSLGIAIPLGLLSAIKRHSLLDHAAQLIAVIGAAIPGFWIALVLILVFAAKLRWLPALGSATFKGMLLPAIILALPNIALTSRLVRATTLDVLNQQYIVTARAKGRSEHGLLFAHALPNVAASLITPISLEIAFLLTGTVIIEHVFAYPGIGRMAVEAALIGDMPVLGLAVLIAGGIYVIANWCADLGMAALDPRLRQHRQS